MKLKNYYVKRLIREALLREMGAAPPVDFMSDMIDIGSPMVKQLYTYLATDRDWET